MGTFFGFSEIGKQGHQESRYANLIYDNFCPDFAASKTLYGFN
jgi:hypothetical protein